MEEAIIALLLSDADLIEIVGGKVRPGRASQTDLAPFVVVQVIDKNRSYTMKGHSGLVRSRVQIDGYADTYAQAKEVSRIIEARLNGYKDAAFKAIFLEDHRDLPAADAGAVTTKFRSSLDITVHYGEPQ
ncbi:tail completion protein gp17 [Rhizobium sp. 9140]|uniref:tail completion protein gp17 n=1 Tax=Rhizobium sp. 9140 TaxID=1761900 RepID=UPI0007915085|nr:DUF3168 domain-containing protein [Rhizobium sp. 9140]CZT36138.1 Protein of unknown function (DUF3168) [Rhizobium sp. 9140]